MLNINKNSNSGSEINLIERNNKRFIIKKINKPTKRSEKNYLKQKNFKSLSLIESIPIKKKFNSKNSQIYLMNYIEGYVASDYCLYADKDSINAFSKLLNFYFNDKIKNSKIILDKSKVILNKVSKIFKNLKSNIKITNNLKNVSFDLIDNLENTIKNNIIYVPISDCHGDFTLSNMIYNKDLGKLYLFDFLDVFLNSYLLDYIKIIQDLKYGWSVRYDNDYLKLKNEIMGKRIISQLPDIEKKHILTYDILLKINMLRIVPYCVDINTDTWLIDVIRRVLSK